MKTGGALCTAFGISPSVSPSLQPVDELSVLLLIEDNLLEVGKFVLATTTDDDDDDE